MCKLLTFRLLLLILLSLSPLTYATTNNEVTTWTQKILMYTLSINYQTISSEEKESAKNFSPSAWVTMKDFYFNEITIIKKHKLILHPNPLSEATLIGLTH